MLFKYEEMGLFFKWNVEIINIMKIIERILSLRMIIRYIVIKNII